MSIPNTLQQLAVAAHACDSKKAEDIRILRLDPSESGLTDYFLICHGLNPRQNEAIADEIEMQLKRQFGIYPNSVEGRRQAEWILLDYVDFIVHVFSQEKRGFYALERLRKSAVPITLAELDAAIAPRKSAVKAASKSAKKSAAKKSAKKTAAKKPAEKAAPKPAAKSTAKNSAKPAAKKSAAKTKTGSAARSTSRAPARKLPAKSTARKPAAKKKSSRR